jgi:hypothetical protein
MYRPMRPKARNKTRRIEIRVTEANFQRIKQEAADMNITVTEYLTKVVHKPVMVKTLYSVKEFVLAYNKTEECATSFGMELRDILSQYYKMDEVAKAAISATLGRMLPPPVNNWSVVYIDEEEMITCDPENLTITDPLQHSSDALSELYAALNDSDKRVWRAKKALEASVKPIDIEIPSEVIEDTLEGILGVEQEVLDATVARQTVDSQHELALSDTVTVSVEVGRGVTQESAVGVSDRLSTYHRCTSNVGVDRGDNYREGDAVSLLSSDEPLDLSVINRVVALT